MNKVVIFFGIFCFFVIVIMQVFVFYGSFMMYGGGMGYVFFIIGGGVVFCGYYDNYYQRYDQYNCVQLVRIIVRIVNGFQILFFFSLSKYFNVCLDNGVL